MNDQNSVQWIPVTEKLPEQMLAQFQSVDPLRTVSSRKVGEVLCLCRDGKKKVMRWGFDEHAWVLQVATNRMILVDPEFVTHWMPLPPAPEVE